MSILVTLSCYHDHFYANDTLHTHTHARHVYSVLSCVIIRADTLIQKLLPLGFSRAAIRKELVATDGDLNEAANNLLSQLPDVQAQGVLASMKKEEKSFSIKSIEVKKFM